MASNRVVGCGALNILVVAVGTMGTGVVAAVVVLNKLPPKRLVVAAADFVVRFVASFKGFAGDS